MEAFSISIFESDEPPMAFDLNCIRNIAPFSLEELKAALKQMSRGRCKDKAGICLEMITNGCDELHTCLFFLFFLVVMMMNATTNTHESQRPATTVRAMYKCLVQEPLTTPHRVHPQAKDSMLPEITVANKTAP